MWQLRRSPAGGEFSGHLETGYTRALKLSTVTTANVNLYRTRNEIKDHNDSWFYTVFQLEGQAIIEQHDRQTVIQPGDITLVDASRPLFNCLAAAITANFAVAAAKFAGAAAEGWRVALRAAAG